MDELLSLQSSHEGMIQKEMSFQTPKKPGVSIESKESTPSSASSDLLLNDQSFKDARDTIRLLSQKLNSNIHK